MFDRIKQAGKTGFIWGDNDCCMFACNVALAITGVDYAKDFRGRYKTKIGAARVLKNIGSGSLRETVTSRVGEEIPLLKCGRGDFVLADQGNGEMLGVCVGEKTAFLTDKNFIYLNTADCITAWRISV